MPRLIITERAAQGLERCRRFLTEHDPQASIRAASAISDAFSQLQQNPESGRIVPGSHTPDLQELIIPFGRTGYVGLYHFDKREQSVFLLAFRHQKEAGY